MKKQTVLRTMARLAGAVFAVNVFLGVILPMTVTVGLTKRGMLQIAGSGIVFLAVMLAIVRERQAADGGKGLSLGAMDCSKSKL